MGLCWEYSQGGGTLHKVDDDTGQRDLVASDGYAGHGPGVNNPDLQDEQGVGPIPRGDYTIENQRDNTTGAGLRLPGSMRLTPSSRNNMHGRAGFLIHGDNSRGDRSASQGCIVFNRAVRNQIANSGDDCLKVVR
jgi:hypothetical protein